MWVYSHVISNGSIVTQLTESKPPKAPSKPKPKLMRLESMHDLVHPLNKPHKPHKPHAKPYANSSNPSRKRSTSKALTQRKGKRKQRLKHSKPGKRLQGFSPKKGGKSRPDSGELMRANREEEKAMAASMGLSVEQMMALEAAEAEADTEDALSSKVYLEAFKRFDQDGSGDLSPDELRAVLASLDDELPEAEIERIIAEADADGDGSIDYHEFANMMQARKRLLFMASKLGEITSKPTATATAQPQGNDFHYNRTGPIQQNKRQRGRMNPSDEIDPKLRAAMCLAPLKVPHGGRRAVGTTVGRKRPGRKKRRRKWEKDGAAGLRRQLKACDVAVAELDEKMREEVQWVQEHCNVTSLRAQLYCKKWGMQKLHNVMKRLEYKEVIAAWAIWRALVLHQRNQEQAELYMKFKGSRRLTALFANWKKKRMLAAWNSWITIRRHQRRLEAEAAARQLQRFVRGFIGRSAARSFIRHYSAVKIQSFVRGYIARLKSKAMMELVRLEKAAIYIQRAYRGYAGKRLAKMILHSHRQAHAATTIQRLHRGFQSRKRLRKHSSAVDIQRVWRGYLEREIVASVRQAVAESIAALRIQACFRGYYGRQLGLELLETRMQVVAEDEAAVRIQSFYRGARCRKSIRRELQAGEASVRLQAAYRGYRGRKVARGLREQRSAVTIQRLHRGVLARRRVLRHREVHDLRARESLRRKEEHIAAMKIQSHVRRRQGQLAMHMLRQAKLEKEAEERVVAAKKIQAQARRRMAKNRAARQRAARRIQARERGRQARAKRPPPRTPPSKKKQLSPHADKSPTRLDEQERKAMEEAAAKRIQARARGNLTRARLERRRCAEDRLQEVEKKKEEMEGRSKQDPEYAEEAKEISEAFARDGEAIGALQGVGGGAEVKEGATLDQHEAATRIQKHARKKLAHSKVKAKRKLKAKTKGKGKPKGKTKGKTKAKSKGKGKGKGKGKTKGKPKAKTPDAAARTIQKQIRKRQQAQGQGQAKTEAEESCVAASESREDGEDSPEPRSREEAMLDVEEGGANVELSADENEANGNIENDDVGVEDGHDQEVIVDEHIEERDEEEEGLADEKLSKTMKKQTEIEAQVEAEATSETEEVGVARNGDEAVVAASADDDDSEDEEEEDEGEEEGEEEEEDVEAAREEGTKSIEDQGEVEAEVDSEAEAALAQLKHVDELKRTEAAIRIQSTIRMYLARITLSKAESSAVSIQSHFRAARDRSKADKIRAELDQEEKKRQEKVAEARMAVEQERLATLKIQAIVRGRQGRLRAERLRGEAAKHAEKLRELRRQQEMEAAATRVQCAFRVRQARKVLHDKQEEHEKKLKVLEEQGLKEAEMERIRAEQEKEMAAIRIQAMLRGKAARVGLKRKLEKQKEEEAGAKKEAEDRLRHVSATRIQALFRGRRSRRRLLEDIAATAARVETREFGDETDNVGEWVEYWDESSQAVYYYNTLTQEARWDKPLGVNGETHAVDGDEDNYHYDEQYYNYDGYYDEAGNWVASDANAAAQPTAGSTEYFDQKYVDADGDGYDDRAQQGYAGYEDTGMVEWEEYYDDNYNCSYYFNNYTQETVWEPPPGFVSKYTDPYYEAPRYEG